MFVMVCVHANFFHCLSLSCCNLLPCFCFQKNNFKAILIAGNGSMLHPILSFSHKDKTDFGAALNCSCLSHCLFLQTILRHSVFVMLYSLLSAVSYLACSVFWPSCVFPCYSFTVSIPWCQASSCIPSLLCYTAMSLWYPCFPVLHCVVSLHAPVVFLPSVTAIPHCYSHPFHNCYALCTTTGARKTAIEWNLFAIELLHETGALYEEEDKHCITSHHTRELSNLLISIIFPENAWKKEGIHFRGGHQTCHVSVDLASPLHSNKSITMICETMYFLALLWYETSYLLFRLTTGMAPWGAPEGPIVTTSHDEYLEVIDNECSKHIEI